MVDEILLDFLRILGFYILPITKSGFYFIKTLDIEKYHFYLKPIIKNIFQKKENVVRHLKLLNY